MSFVPASSLYHLFGGFAEVLRAFGGRKAGKR
jgi:hypothetical protein